MLSLRIPTSLRWFLGALLALTGLCVATELVCAQVLHLGYPYDWPLFAPAYSFNDLIIYHPRFAAFGTPAFFDPPWYPFTYPAPVALLYRAFYSFADYVDAFLAVGGMLVAAAIALVARELRKTRPWGAVVLILLPVVVCAYPVAFEFQQANLELFVALLVALGMWAFYRQKPRAAAILFSGAASLKLFPLIFLLLLVARRQYRQAAAGVAFTLATILGSLWIVCPSMAKARAGMAGGAAFFEQEYALKTTTAFDHSLPGLVKAGVRLAHPGQASLAPGVLSLYLGVAAVGGVLLYMLTVRRLPLLNQIVVLSVASVLLPPVSFDYTLLHLYGPWLLLVLFVLGRGQGRAGLVAALVYLAVVFAPTSELMVRGLQLGSQVKALALVALLVVAVRNPWTWAELDGCDCDAG